MSALQKAAALTTIAFLGAAGADNTEARAISPAITPGQSHAPKQNQPDPAALAQQADQDFCDNALSQFGDTQGIAGIVGKDGSWQITPTITPLSKATFLFTPPQDNQSPPNISMVWSRDSVLQDGIITNEMVGQSLILNPLGNATFPYSKGFESPDFVGEKGPLHCLATVFLNDPDGYPEVTVSCTDIYMSESYELKLSENGVDLDIEFQRATGSTESLPVLCPAASLAPSKEGGHAKWKGAMSGKHPAAAPGSLGP